MKTGTISSTEDFRGVCFFNAYFPQEVSKSIFTQDPMFEGSVFDACVFEFRKDSDVIQSSNAILHNPVFTIGQDFGTAAFEDIYTRIPKSTAGRIKWEECTFTGILTASSGASGAVSGGDTYAFLGTYRDCAFSLCSFGANAFGYRPGYRISFLESDFSDSNFEENTLDTVQFDSCTFRSVDFYKCRIAYRKSYGILFDKKHIYTESKRRTQSYGSGQLSKGYTKSTIDGCTFDCIQFEREDIFNERIPMPYKGIDSCTFHVSVPNAFKPIHPRDIPQYKEHLPAWLEQDLPDDGSYYEFGSFSEMLDTDDIWALIGYERSDLIRAKAVVYTFWYPLQRIMVGDESSIDLTRESVQIGLDTLGAMDTWAVYNTNIDIFSRSSGPLATLTISYTTFEECDLNFLPAGDGPSILKVYGTTFINCRISGRFAKGLHQEPNTYVRCDFRGVELTIDYLKHVTFNTDVFVECVVDSSTKLNDLSIEDLLDMGFIIDDE